MFTTTPPHSIGLSGITGSRTSFPDNLCRTKFHNKQPPSHPSPYQAKRRIVKILVAIPTYNEALNIEPFIKAVFENIPPEGEILVIDDNSPDGTAKIVESLIHDYPRRLHILNRPEKQGLARAYLAAFDWGLSRDYDAFLEMDADFSHNPKYIPEMINAVQTHEAVIGSRNIKGGGVEGWSVLRNFISKGGSFYARTVLGCPVRDLTGGFNMWTRTALQKINLSQIISRGYSFQVEMKYRAYAAGCRIKEIPILFTDRKFGNSKMSKKIFMEALVTMWKIKKSAGRDTGIDQFFKFLVTGGLGTITNLLIFFLCVDVFRLSEIPVSVFCFLIAASQNYIINHKWSFRQNTAKEAISPQRWLQFITGSLFGLAVNITVMKIILSTLAPPFKFIAQACGIAAGTMINFGFSKFVVFRNTIGGKV
ncbi:MAG: glycosyltransferase family 2 protein [Treponema sp.]|nr:glycosyltransferase family 2 protein [Treponema sp.]